MFQFHINQHTGAKPYKCPYCDKSFASSGNCYSHKSRMHPEISIGDGKVKKDISEKIKETKKPVMKQQLKLRPIAPKPVVLKANFKYQCTICHHSFMKRDNFMVRLDFIFFIKKKYMFLKLYFTYIFKYT